MDNTTVTNSLLNDNSSLATMITTIAICTAVALGATAVFSQKKKSSAKDEKPLPLPETPVGSKFVSLPKAGVRLRYTDTAKKDVVKNAKQVTFLLIHGFAGVLETWEFLTPYLVKAKENEDLCVRVVALDVVGSGFSDKPTGSEFDYSYRNQGKVLSEFISTLGLTNVVVVGHSSGTVIGAATALEQQKEGQNVVGAIFIACALFRPKSAMFSKAWLKPLFSWMTTKMMADRKQSLEKMHLPEHSERILTDEFVEKFAGPARFPNFNDALVETVMAKEAPYEKLVDEMLSPQGSAKPIPMLFFWGNQDTYKPLPHEQIDVIEQKIEAFKSSSKGQPSAPIETILLEGCHHYPQHEQPKDLADGILSFARANVPSNE